jgi:hypothetical protein
MKIQPHGNGDLPIFVSHSPKVIGEVDDYAQSHIKSQKMVRMHNGVVYLQHQSTHCASKTVSNATHVSQSEGWEERLTDFQGLVGIRRPILST